MENGQLDLQPPVRRRAHATLEQQVAIADLLRKHLRKNQRGLFSYEGHWTDATIASEISKVMPGVNANHVNRVRTELFGLSRDRQPEEVRKEKRKPATPDAALAAILERLADIEARLDFAGLTLPQDAKK